MGDYEPTLSARTLPLNLLKLVVNEGQVIQCSSSLMEPSARMNYSATKTYGVIVWRPLPEKA